MALMDTTAAWAGILGETMVGDIKVWPTTIGATMDLAQVAQVSEGTTTQRISVLDLIFQVRTIQTI